MHDDPAYLRSALTAGASGYLLKRAVDTELLAAIRAVHRGGIFLDARLAGVLIQDILAKRGKRADPIRQVNILSDRELQVLRLVAQGYTNCASPKLQSDLEMGRSHDASVRIGASGVIPSVLFLSRNTPRGLRARRYIQETKEPRKCSIVSGGSVVTVMQTADSPM
jgi:hypothetical protein